MAGPRDLRQLAFASTTDAIRDMARRAPGGVVHDEGGLVLVAGPHWLPVLVNTVTRLDPSVAADDVIARANDFFFPRGRGYSVQALDGRDDDLITAADQAGFASQGDAGATPLMVLEAPPASVDVPDGGRVERATTAAHVDDIVALCADAYAVYGMPADVVPASLLPPSIVLAAHLVAYVAYDDVGPVATAQALATHGCAYVQWVATAQRAFKRGFGGAITQATTIGGFELGASMATLIASPMGAPLYRKLGWTDVGTISSRFTLPPR
ncbi:MAG: hypothetical protein QOE63_2128 [Acidimicrobiaceae bacterium]